MALIHCPECDREISDRVKACPHCGYPLVEELSASEVLQPQQVEVTGVKLSNQNLKKFIIIMIVAIIVVLIVFFGVKAINEQKAQRDYEVVFNTYVDNLILAQYLMIEYGSIAEELCNITYSVWYNAIYEEADSKTDKFTRPGGTFVNDFNTALDNLYSNTNTKSIITGIESGQSDVQELIKELQNPPEGLENCYDSVTELYTAFKGLTDLAISPKGSLTSFGDTKSEKISDFMDAYDKLNNQIPAKFETENTSK